MQSSIFHKLSNVLWVLIVVLVVLLAVYVSVGRLAMSSLGGYQGDILRELNGRLPFTIEAERVSGDWQSFSPIVVMSGLRLNMPGAEHPLELSEGRISVDVFHSLLTGALQMTSLRLEGLTLRGELDADGGFRLVGFDGGGSPLGDWLRQFLLNIENITLDQTILLLGLPDGNKRSLDLNLEMLRDGSRRRVVADLVSDRGTQISARAEGVGNPFKPTAFSGDLYLDIGSSDMGAVQDVPPLDSLPVRAQGAIALELWLGWDKGVPDLTGRLELSDLVLSDKAQSWQLPLQRVAMEATLIERKNRWTLFGSNVELQQAGTALKLPRLQVDAWGQALRVRTAELPLEPLNSLLLGVDEVPDALADVFAVLQPSGDLSALQFSLGNYGKPGGDWELDANFEQLEVEPWRGAPGARSASGYLELAPGGGFVVIDSRQFALEFPKVYSSALVFDDIYGTVNLDWDAENLLLSSGPITASGEEGVATALFSLNIPLRKTDVGLEMDLLVGLSNTDPVYRDKFLPYILNDSLLQWLDSSIGEGRIDQGAFLWRGSLPPIASEMRTIQLFFNVADTDLQFDPAWPSLSGVDSIVLIDDTNVSVWAERASLFELNSAWISAEAWMDERGKMVLAVDGRVRGPAEDGLALLNDSPIGALLGNGFEQWSLSGELEAKLSLQLNLAAGQLEPSVTVHTTWHDVDVGIEPGNLLVRAVNGELSYSTDEGLAAPALTGSLWGQALRASIGQRHRGAYEPGTSTVEVQLDGRVDMASVQRWLDLDALAFARGGAAVEGRVDITPGSAPVIHLASDLAGVSLDLPEPWDKQPAERSQLDLSFPVGGDSSLLQMRIDDQVGLNLEIADGGLLGGMLAFHEPAPVPQPGVLGVRGKLVAMEVEQWLAFVEQYFADAMKTLIPDAPLEAVPGTGRKSPDTGLGDSADPLAAIAPAVLAVAPDPEAGVARTVRPPMELMNEGQGLVLQIEAMQVAKLGLYGQQLEDVEFSLLVAGQRWQVAATTDWLRGELVLERAGAVSSLDIAYLDLHGLEQLQLERGSSDSSLELPAIDVRLREIWQGERPLGNLDFQLRSDAELLSANNISGEIAAMRLLPERPGQLSWRQGDEATTALSASLQIGDLGETLRLLGYQQILETRQGSMDLNLEWPGAPQDFSLAQGSGSLRMDLGSGSFLEAPSSASGALRVVSVLNLADIVSRLSLSHMFESGIPFDSVDGEIFLHQGTIEVAGMDVQGSSSFRFSGVSDVAQRSLDGELVATLPVANNLPWVAALAGGLPVAAGVFVVSKVFEKQFNRLTSAVYSVDGSWDDPQVNFARIFDDEGLTGAGAEQAATSVGPEAQLEAGDELEGAPLTLEPIELPGEPGEPGSDQSESL